MFDMWRIHPAFQVLLPKQWRESTVQQVLGYVELEDAKRPEYFHMKKIYGGDGVPRLDANDVNSQYYGSDIQ